MPQPPAPAAALLGEHLARIALGDRRAFQALYNAAAPRLLGVILRIQRHRDTAEEVLQEVFLKIWDAAGAYQAAQAQPLTWMQAIARHAAIDSLRRQRADPDTLVPRPPVQHAGAVPAGQTEAEDDPLDHLATDAPGPADLLAQAWEARDLRQCMGQLEAPQRHSLALAFYDGLSHAEVAQHLGEPLGTVKSWLRRSLMALQRCLAACGHRGTGPASP
ncbi:sigma-70 family RNA polymerase sigma factor [Ideonella livida]|uniref:Sigma-70 family RNA polymerase sigma factor n=1 Tax=Ideonella livida TaxID=2707176 RepID=A0A7C9PKS3_9BURK|nr:sigma-70 family RNA polymerase sigma factor [Ideonella livida]NDY93692.1 sigma-70 family RNA polymerase sigma factor [Ideonella livida]